jgi:hypothetical protein
LPMASCAPSRNQSLLTFEEDAKKKCVHALAHEGGA